MRAGLIAALPGEVRSLARLRALGTAELGSMQLRLSGMGAVRARAAARELVRHGAQVLVSWGSAAALSPMLRAGDLVLPSHVIAADGRRYTAAGDLYTSLIDAISAAPQPPGLRIRHGTLIETHELLDRPSAKARLYARSGAAVSDMESAAVAEVAHESGLAFIAVRVVVDDAYMTLPPAVRAAVDERGALRPFRILGALAAARGARHEQVRALKQLAVAFRAAQRTLRPVAPRLLDMLERA